MGEIAFAEALSDCPILMNITYGKRQQDIDHLVFTSNTVIMNECKNTKEDFFTWYSWFLSHVLNRFAEGYPIAQFFARTFGYHTKNIVFTLTIPRLSTEPKVKASIRGARIYVIETGKQILTKTNTGDWNTPVRTYILNSFVNNRQKKVPFDPCCNVIVEVNFDYA